jgi:hypothetical protein
MNRPVKQVEGGIFAAIENGESLDSGYCIKLAADARKEVVLMQCSVRECADN